MPFGDPSEAEFLVLDPKREVKKHTETQEGLGACPRVPGKALEPSPLLGPIGLIGLIGLIDFSGPKG